MREEYLSGLKKVLEKAKSAHSTSELYSLIKDDFDFYEVYGDRSWGDVFMTSYFEPVISGSLKPTAVHTAPLYSDPKDIIRFDLKVFQPLRNELVDLKDPPVLRGRLQGDALVPYYSRKEISENVLKGRKLEICWVDPFDAFLLEIQGSGTVRLPNGSELHLNYANQNGHRYEAIGKFVKARLPSQEINLATIEAYLRSLPKNEGPSKGEGASIFSGAGAPRPSNMRA